MMEISSKVLSVVRSCKTESQLSVALSWAYRVTTRKNISDNLAMILWQQNTRKEMTAYIRRLV